MNRQQTVSCFVMVGSLLSFAMTSFAQIPGVRGGVVVATPPATSAPVQVTSPPTSPSPRHAHRVAPIAGLPSVAVCQREVNAVQSGAFACPAPDVWARLQQHCPPHGANFTRAFEGYVRTHCAAADLNILERTRGAPLAPECVGNATEVEDHGRVVDCMCNEGLIAVRLWSRRSGRPRVDCFGSALRANVVTQEWVRGEIADVHDGLTALCAPNAERNESLVSACSDLRHRIDTLNTENEAVTPSAAGTTPPPNGDLSDVQTRLTEIGQQIGILQSQVHDVTCRLTRLERRELPTDCINLPDLPEAYLQPPTNGSNHRFDLGANVFVSIRLGSPQMGPGSLGMVGTGTWRYRFDGSASTDFYLRADGGAANFGAGVGAVYVIGGGAGFHHQFSPTSWGRLGFSGRAYAQPGDDTLRDTRGALRGWDLGLEGMARVGGVHWGFVGGLLVHYGEALFAIHDPRVPGGLAWINYSGVVLTPEVGASFTF